jgi:hypothetical protein
MKTTIHSRYLKISLLTVLTFGIFAIYSLPANAQYVRQTDSLDTQRAELRADTDADGDDDDVQVDDTDRAQNYNASRSNRPTTVRDEAEDDDVQVDDTDRAQDYNASRSNKPTTVRDEAEDDDTDDVERANYNNTRSNRATVRSDAIADIDKTSPRIRQIRGIDKATPLLYERIRTSGSLCPVNDCDDINEEQRPDATQRRQALRIEVSGDEVRAASDEAKVEVRRRLQEIDAGNNANDFGIRVAMAAIDNEAITDIVTDDEQTTVRFRTPARIFGIFPAQLSARVEATTEGERVRYPWYAFLASKEDVSSLRELAAEIRANHDSLFAAAVEEE